MATVFWILVALCRPQYGFQWEEVKRKGVDILVAMDVSSSMLAKDVDPNRLERARREVIDLLALLQGDRIGLIAFAGIPYLQCPLTLDYGAMELFMNYLDTDLIPVPGTAIADAIRLATDVFQKRQSKTKALILITDGEDHGGDPVAAAKEAKRSGVKIFTIGIGKEGGAPIPAASGGGFRKDQQGNLILTKLDEKTLKEVALETDGAYVRSVTGDLDLEKIYLQEIRQGMEHVELKSSRRKRWEERFQWPLGFAMLFLFLEPFIPVRKGKKF
jgi:Ca-activated chloride channel family protein